LALSVATDWHVELSADPLRGPHDPLFPATEIALGHTGVPQPNRLRRFASQAEVRIEQRQKCRNFGNGSHEH
jgi:hypothetical protein